MELNGIKIKFIAVVKKINMCLIQTDYISIV